MITQRQSLFGGIGLVACASLVLEVTLTRLYSALLGNHLAFLAISLSLFGIGLGGVLLYVAPGLVRQDNLFGRLSILSGAASMATLVAVVYVTRTRPVETLDVSGIGRLSLLYGISSLPFVLVGVVVAAGLRHAASDVSRLYLSDLLGAAAGGLFAIAALRTGAPRAGLIVAVACGVAAFVFALGSRSKVETYGRSERASLSVAAVFVAGTATVLAGDVGAPWLKLPNLRYARIDKVEFQKWNELALITVDRPEKGMAWMRMDGSAATAILDPKTTPPLHPDEMAYVLHKDKGPVLVIGAGGGRDVRAALKAGQKEVYAAEINPIIVDDVMRGRYHKFSGGLFDKPEVKVAIADGRSYVRRSKIQFRNIVLSLVDTWAAASVGALALSENSLYTVEAFDDFIRHLVPEGTLLVNRWDAEFERLLALGAAGLRASGATEPARHMFACSHMRSTSLLIKRTPLEPAEIQALRAHCKKHRFTEVFAPDDPKTDLRSRLTTMPAWAAAPHHPTDLEPPTDDRPFFFYTVPARLLGKALRERAALADQNQGLLTLLGLLVASTAVAAVTILVPLAVVRREARRGLGRGARLGALAYFAALGAGFVLAEVSLVQHFVMFLGHPVYALSTVLVALLAWSGIGSLLTARLAPAQAAAGAVRRGEGLVVALAVYAIALGPVLRALVALSFGVRLGVTLALLAPLGLAMGAMAPLGIRLLDARAPTLIPWCWGTNGLFSVVATAAGTLLAMHAGFSSLLVAAGLAYLVAIGAIHVLSRSLARVVPATDGAWESAGGASASSEPARA